MALRHIRRHNANPGRLCVGRCEWKFILGVAGKIGCKDACPLPHYHLDNTRSTKGEGYVKPGTRITQLPTNRRAITHDRHIQPYHSPYAGFSFGGPAYPGQKKEEMEIIGIILFALVTIAVGAMHVILKDDETL